MRIEEGSLRVLVSIPLKKGGRACRIRPDFYNFKAILNPRSVD